jgi:hypothetical protein
LDYEKLKEEIKQIDAIAGDVPERFRDKCFDVLLGKLIGQPSSLPNRHVDTPKQQEPEPEGYS